MARYRKRPVVIEARGLTYQTFNEVAEWSGAERVMLSGLPLNDSPRQWLVIHTLEGDHRADIGDWIIKGVKGEFYPCKPDIFAMTYERVEG